ncbi:DEAD/DEAH box helicase [archaeon]|jgi:ERCC4-related helicase|nr:DEAD/DEAH box helicase [archaeon]
MINTSNDINCNSDGLLPFQTEFAKDFLNSNKKKFWQLISPIGLGKQNLVAKIISLTIKENKNKRILIITPPALSEYWEYSISLSRKKEKILYPTLIVDRKDFLELESNVDIDESPWPKKTIIIMSLYLAKRDDMVSEISDEFWDLIIFDESHMLSGKEGKNLLEQLNKKKNFQHGLLLTATPQNSDLTDGIITKTFGNDLYDWDGNPIFQKINDVMKLVYYQKSNEEILFYNKLQDFITNIADNFYIDQFYLESILRSASSSMQTLEMKLRSLYEIIKIIRNKIAHGELIKTEEISIFKKYFNFKEDILSTDQSNGTLTIKTEIFEDLLQQIESLLYSIDDLPVDSKLTALILKIENLFKKRKNTHICVISSFLNTINYLNENLYEFEKPVWAITGDIKPDDSFKIIKSFQDEGGILLITDTSLKGLTFEFVQEGINYDLPTNKNIFDIRWGRFARFGRKTEFNMIAFIDQKNALDYEITILEKLKNLYVHE